jgi:hypothetical protein
MVIMLFQKRDVAHGKKSQGAVNNKIGTADW